MNHTTYNKTGKQNETASHGNQKSEMFFIGPFETWLLNKRGVCREDEKLLVLV